MKYTVFTPTYNRVGLLKKLYEYLCSENYYDMEWLVIDDGSNDSTKGYIESVQSESKFAIRYIYQENSGKYMAFNRAIDEAKGEYFVCIDSDDKYTMGAFGELEKLADGLQEDEAGLCFLAADFNGNIIGSAFPNELQKSNLIDLYYKYKVNGDKGILHKTEILKKYRFPVIQNEKFVTESVLYAQISKHYTYRLVNKVYELVDYQTDGLSSAYQKLLILNPRGALINYQAIDQFSMRTIPLIKNTIRFTSFVFYLEENWGEYLQGSAHKLMFILMTPIGFCLSKMYKNNIR